MKTKSKKQVRARHMHEREAEGGAGGAIAGAALGAMAGPPGIIAGAVLGGLVGAIAGAAVEQDTERANDRTSELDEQIGVIGGDLGAPNLEHPPATRGTYSGGSAGAAASSGQEPAEGPMQAPD
jgi:hypothetical protein